MTVLSDFAQFDGLHWETGTIRNALAYQRVVAPHTGEPFSEAFLMGVSGGAVFGYFTFDYQGYDPILALITRNTFDPMDTLCERMGIAQTVLQSTEPHKGDANLLKVLDSGRPAIVWADIYSLPYYGLAYDKSNWAMMPVLVYGMDGERVFISDRSRQPLIVSVQEFTKARGRVKKDKYRVISLDPPDERKLPAAVQKGLWQCIRLFTEAPPKGARHNLGFAAYQHWANMLTNKRNPQSWNRFFPRGARLYAALAGSNGMTGIYPWVRLWGAGDGAERGMYADFLEEAAIVLSKPGLSEAGELFRYSQKLWCKLSDAALPDGVPLLKQTRELLQLRHDSFIGQGQAAAEEIARIDHALKDLREHATQEFPLKDGEIVDLLAGLSMLVRKIHDIESQAVEQMQAALA
jgi:hypothetical protein